MKPNPVLLARIAARIVDTIILMLIFFIIKRVGDLPYVVLVISDRVIAILYFIYYHAKTGQTIGKKTFNICVVDAGTEEGITYRQSFLRQLPWVVIAAVNVLLLYLVPSSEVTENNLTNYTSLAFLIIFFSMLLDKNHRGIHDKLGGTKVIRVEENNPEPAKETV